LAVPSARADSLLAGMAPALESDPRGDWLRMLGGVLLAVGAAILFVRKTDDWAAFPLLLVVAIPCVLVFGVGAAAALATRAVGRWHAVLMVTGVLLSVLAFGQLWDLVGLDTDAPGFGFLLSACVVLLAAFGSFRVGAAYQALLAAVAGIAAWLFFFEMILDDPGATTFRWLLLVLCFVYAVLAFALRGRDAPQAPELVTAAGIAGVLVGTIGIVDGAGGALAVFFGGAPSEGEGQSFVWDLFLLAFSLGLVAYGAAAHARGPAYVGFLGLLAFTLIQGAEVNALLEGESPDSSFAGWPLILLLIGAGALAAGLFMRKPPPAGAGVPAGPRQPEPETTYDVRS
jgi:hypothetical protein